SFSVFLFFFFSSRRRHTRFSRDWSSDVCSSDLFVAGESLGSFGGQSAFRDVPEMLRSVDGAVWTGTPSFTPLWQQLCARARPGRSEERRVGKEWRSGGGAQR